jgi:hypothetical protein
VGGRAFIYVQDLVERRGFGCVGGDDYDDDNCDDLEKGGRKKNRSGIRTACWYDADMQYVNGRSRIYKHQPESVHGNLSSEQGSSWPAG